MSRRIPLMQANAQALMNQYGIRPTKKRGQNFLIDEEVYERILDTADLLDMDTVLEIGPGLGTLTGYLADEVQKVIAVELDKKLVELLRDTFVDHPTVAIVEGDILDQPVSVFGVQPPYKVVANIPYNITAPILRKFLVDDVQPTDMTLLMQREVGERITAKPGSMSILGISVQLYGTPSLVDIVPARALLPPPEVESCIVRIDNIHPFPYTDISERDFWRVVKIGFSAKRKQLKNNLASGLDISINDVVGALEKIGLLPTVRAQELSIMDWYEIVKLFSIK